MDAGLDDVTELYGYLIPLDGRRCGGVLPKWANTFLGRLIHLKRVSYSFVMALARSIGCLQGVLVLLL